jgi:hypothetical protein
MKVAEIDDFVRSTVVPEGMYIYKDTDFEVSALTTSDENFEYVKVFFEAESKLSNVVLLIQASQL